MPEPTDVIDPVERRERGKATYRAVLMQEPPAADSARTAALLDFVFAEIWSRPVLTRRERRLIALSCLAGADAHGCLADHLYGALASADFNRDELDEWILHFAVYCGWGKAETAERILDTQWSRVCRERGDDPTPRRMQPPTAQPEDQELRKQGGEQEFRDVNWVPAPARGVPYYDDGILNFVFGAMWKRPGLSRRDRRWITLACVALDDTVGPIRSHVYSAMKSGDVAYHEMQELVLQFAADSGWPKASFLQQAVDEEHSRVIGEAAQQAGQ
jgi:4-carboxymuconolactone decarboxylase